MTLESITVSKSNRFYSPLRYPGGKTILAKFLFKLIDTNKIVNCTYVEPYAGGAGAALSLLILEKVDKIIINDLDVAIYSFWKSILSRTDDFIERIRSTPVTMEEWHKQRKVYAARRSSQFDRGFATFFLNRTNHSGVIEGGPIGGYEQKGNWKINARFRKDDLIAKIQKIASYKNRIQVLNLDGIKLMKKVASLPNVMIYIDPPYFEKGSVLYLNHYKKSDHQNLAKFLNSHAQLNWLLTYDNVDQIKSLYPDRSKYQFALHYHTRLPKQSTEILIKSDPLLIPQ